jgi:hypothetical protein
MGEVYLTEDTKLNRKVALKILPADVAANEDRMRRFVQEAKSASALNHPNIITIYEIDQVDSLHFIASEFIDGQTLRDPATVEAVRQQNHLRPRERRLLDFGWNAEGKLWIAWRLPESRSSLVFGIPGAVRRYLDDRRFVASAKDAGRTLSHISINEKGAAYGWGPILRYLGADGGDTMLAEFDLTSSLVVVSFADDSLLDES